MDEFVSKKLLVAKFNELASKYIDGDKRQRGLAYTTAADAIALADATDVQPVDRWTSIEESKPKDMQQVLAVVDGDVREAFYNAGCFIGSNFYRSINEVKWWQPLPEPPKDGEHND